jgi:hypothetical protein
MAGGCAGYWSIGLIADKHLSELEGRVLRQRQTNDSKTSRGYPVF